MPNGKLEAIWIKRAKRGPMDVRSSATMIAGRGLKGNADMGRKRQITIIEKEVWAAHMAALDGSIDPASRRANLMVSGFPLADSRKKIMRIGNCRIRIWGETKPCERMDEALPGLQGIMRPDWGGGAFGLALDDGDIHVGDTITWEDEE